MVQQEHTLLLEFLDLYFIRLNLPIFLYLVCRIFGITILFITFIEKLLKEKKYSIVLYLVLLIVYSFGPLSNLFPMWLISLIFVITIFLLNAKKKLMNFNLTINIYEFMTLGKMILLSAVVLPLLPKEKYNSLFRTFFK